MNSFQCKVLLVSLLFLHDIIFGSALIYHIERNSSEGQEMASSIVDYIEIHLQHTKDKKIHIIEGLLGGETSAIDFDTFYSTLNERYISLKTENFQGNFHSESRKRRSVMIFIDDAEFIHEMFKNATVDTFDYKVYFSIVALKKFNVKEQHELFEILWQNFILNVSLIMRSEDKIELFTYFPFELNKTCGSTIPRKINSYQNGMWKSQMMFPHKLKNMNNCTIKVGCSLGVIDPYLIFENKSDTNSTILGIEREIIDEIGLLLNFNPEFSYQGSFAGYLFQNGSATGAIEKLMSRKLDIVIGFISLQQTRTKFLSDTKPFTFEPMVILVPPGEEYGHFEKFARPFHFAVWIIIVGIFSGIFILFATFHIILKTLNRHYFLEIRHPFSDFMSVIFGVTQHRLPFQNIPRFVLMSFILYCLVIRTVYQSGLYQTIKNNDRKPQMESMDEIIEKGYKFNVYETMAQRSIGLKFYNYSKPYPNGQFYLKAEETIDPENKVVSFFHLNLARYLNKFRPDNKKFHICKERYVTNAITFYLTRNHYLTDEISEKIEELAASGIIKYIEDEYFSADDGKVVHGSKGPKQLGLTQLRGAFYLLCICLAISSLVFVFEIIVKSRRAHKHR